MLIVLICPLNYTSEQTTIGWLVALILPLVSLAATKKIEIKKSNRRLSQRPGVPSWNWRWPRCQGVGEVRYQRTGIKGYTSKKLPTQFVSFTYFSHYFNILYAWGTISCLMRLWSQHFCFVFFLLSRSPVWDLVWLTQIYRIIIGFV